MMLFPLATGIYGWSSRAYAGQPFTTVVPPNATFAAPIGTPITVPTPIPTLGPGQYFEQGDGLPQVTRPDLLEEPFGYSEILGKPGLYLVWSTDDDGKKHFYVIDEGNRYFEKIKTAVDFIHSKYPKVTIDDTKKKFIRNTLNFFKASFVTGLCGAGTILSALGTPASAPLTGVFLACTGGAIKFRTDSRNSLEDNNAILEEYAFLEEETRKDIEGYFVQIPYWIQD